MNREISGVGRYQVSGGQSRLPGIVERAGPNNRRDASSQGRENAQWHAEDEDGDARYIYKYLCRRRGGGGWARKQLEV
jgi:hypothetical protein